MMDLFYLEFEKSFRGTREQILERMKVYDDFLLALRWVHPHAAALDLGCGRGEWLEKTQSLGFSVHGVDLDAGMLQSCRERDLDVHQTDALDYLRSLPDESQALVTAFHLIEHIGFDSLQELLQQALRVLKPAGLLVMETPNPENLEVATRNFYLDPTHERPIPPELLTFLVRQAGYRQLKLLRLQESAGLPDKLDPSLADVLGGVSPDYAVIAQKEAAAEDERRFESAFARNRGVSLQTLVERYDRNTRSQWKAIQTQQKNLEQQLHTLNEAMPRLTEQLERVRQLEAELRAAYGSRSWRITAPLRWLNLQWRRLREQGFRLRLLALVRKLRPVKAPGAVFSAVAKPDLTPRAQEILQDLKKALSEQREP